MVKGYKKCFRNESITYKLEEINNANEFVDWKENRNILVHRSLPGRLFHSGGEHDGKAFWKLKGIDINTNLTLDRYQWLSSTITSLICVFRSNPASDSGPKWPLNPAESGHRFRSNPATFWPGPEYLKSEASLDNLTMFGHHGSSIEERRPRCQERGYPCARSKKC